MFFQNGVGDRDVTRLFLDHMVQIWDPMLGLINDLGVPRMTFPAAALSRAFVLSFVYLVFPIRLYNDHKYSSPPSSKASRDERLLLGAWSKRANGQIQ
jgi:hypothetical protein